MWIDFFERSSAKWNDVEFFILSYNTVLKFSDLDTEQLSTSYPGYLLLGGASKDPGGR